MDFICAKCHQKLEKDPTLIANGCQNCGSKVFITKTSLEEKRRETCYPKTKESPEEEKEKWVIKPIVLKESPAERKRKEDLMADNLPAIKLREKGVYEVNIDGLFRGDKLDPIILSGKPGIYRVEFPSKGKNKKKV
ncbi:MAG: Zn-ribbon domain-containing protein [Candidatus Heimdallarchaeota archaeon]|nr:Zn-ribbon domain-containing protein [Candidatus Heimdallarchaeota archaeon]